MSDLISRSQLLKEIETWGGCVEALHDYIQNMPTAYDINKVVEELNELDVKSITRYKNGNFGNFDGVEYYIKKRKAIEIVKQEAEKFGTDINVVSNGWIPCSERVPKVEDLHEKSVDDCTCYLIQRRCGIMDVAHYIKVYGEPYFEANSIKMKDVVAWMPLPQPYQPKGE